MSDITLPLLRIKSPHAEFTLRCACAAWSDQHGGATGRYDSDRPGLVLISATGPDTSVKAARACLYSPEIAVTFELEQEETITRLARATVDGKPCSYQASATKLAPGVVHLVALARVPGLLPCLSDDHLWTELSSPRYTTPLLRSWVGWIKRKLLERGQLAMAEGYGEQSAGVLTVEPDELDEVVSNGVRSGYLKLKGNQ